MVALAFDIKQIVLEYQLVDPGDTLVVAVSAGPDSMALLHILAFLRKDINCFPIAVYVDHGLRPAEIPGEIDCVRKAAKQLNVPCEIIPVDTPSLIKAKKLSIEHAARELRYQALRECAARNGAAGIAVAHTADDQAEELLLRLLRGSGRKGLAGMLIRQGDIIRPLLTTDKKGLLEYLARHSIAFCHDSSNDDPQFLRNRIRHHLLPFLEKEFDPGIRKALLKTAANLSEDEDYLESVIKGIYRQLVSSKENAEGRVIHVLDRPELTKLLPGLQRRLVETLLWQLGCPARYEHIMAVVKAGREGRTGSELHLSKGLRVGVTSCALEFSYPQGKTAWRGKLQG